MQAILVRIGVDHAYGHWNAPADPQSGEFIYVPIPEKAGTKFHPGCEKPYDLLAPALHSFANRAGLDLIDDLKCPRKLLEGCMHLDPDFETLTYGDDGDKRGSHIRRMNPGDLLVFYAGLRPIARRKEQKLIYALIGLLVVDEIVPASDVPESHWNENAHTRKIKRGAGDIVVRAKRGVSGRFSRFIPFGEYRDRAYRVRRDLLDAWGGLSVNDGYVQRSARPPRFSDPIKFRDWLMNQNVELVAENNPDFEPPRVVMVHLRQPDRHKPTEMRSDPFWEFGSFGCTGCHSTNLMHPDRIDELDGVRLAFAQGGKNGFRLIMLTPPVRVVRHRNVCELRWHDGVKPFRYVNAPLLINNAGHSDFPQLKTMFEGSERTTWVAKFSSAFRSRRMSLPNVVATQMTQRYQQMCLQAEPAHFADTYDQTLPYPPNVIDRNRSETYANKLREATKKPWRC